MSTPHSTVTDPTGVDPDPSCDAPTAAPPGPPWLVQLAGEPAAMRSVLRGMVMHAEQAAEPSDEWLLVALRVQ